MCALDPKQWYKMSDGISDAARGFDHYMWGKRRVCPKCGLTAWQAFHKPAIQSALEKRLRILWRNLNN